MTFKKWSDLEKYIKKACQEAVNDTIAYYFEVVKVHMETDFYAQVNPVRYERSMQFYNSAVMQMVKGKANEILGKVYMNPDLMQRQQMSNGTVAYDDGFSGRRQLQLANKGSHGGYYETEISYWQNFLKEFNETVEEVLLLNLDAHGIPLKKA